MIIPGAHRIELATGGLGFAARDARRPDIGPVRPGYLLIPGASTLVPSPPIFDSVVAADGYLTVDVHSPSAVDGYEIGVSATIQPPETWWSTASGHLVQPLATGTYYLWARASYQGAYSSWSLYGQLSPGQEEWRLTWADEAVSGTNHTAYPYATVAYGHSSGWQYATAGGMRIRQEVAYVDAYGLSTLAASGGVHGTRIDARLDVGASYPAAKAGVAWGFAPTTMAAAPTATPYYGLCIRQADGKQYLGLCCVTDQTATLISEAEVTAYMTSRTEGGGTVKYLDVSVQARENAVIVYAEGVAVISATATGITWGDTLTGVGLWYQGSSSYGYTTTRYMDSGMEDYIRVYARDHTGEPETVDPGSADHNDLGGRSAADCHPAAAISNTPAGSIAATTVQAAIDELDAEKQPKDADLTAIAALTGTGYPKRTADDTWSMSSAVVEKATTQTVNFDNSMTAAQINALVAAVPLYVPRNAAVTFQFADGAYSLSAPIYFDGFFGGGRINIYGNQSESGHGTLRTTQGVHLDFSGSSTSGIYVSNCKCNAYISDLKITVLSEATTRYCVYADKSSYLYMLGCYLLGTSNSGSYNSTGAGISNGALFSTLYNYASNLKYGFYSSFATLHSAYNDDTGTAPAYGLYANGGQITKQGTQPSGATLDEATANGGQIRGADTYWTSGNDGSGSGLDADTLDGTHLTGVCLWAGALASAPTGAEGKIYYNTGDSKVYIYANGGWKALT